MAVDWRYSWRILLIVAALAGSIAFVCIHGVRILDFTYDAWLVSRQDVIDDSWAYFLKGDLIQHYLGWQFFRNSPWNLPIGLMDGVIYPEKISIMYADSIPLLAIFFKMLSPLLPSTFQYFGLWGLACYIMQSVVAAFIIRYYSRDNIICLLGALFFVFSTTLMQRLYVHSALAGQWMILLGMLLCLYRNRLSCRTLFVSWGVLAFIGVGIHAYFIPMNFLLLLGMGSADLIVYRHVKRFLSIMLIYAFSSLAALALLGAFEHGNIAQSGGFGVYGSNLNTFFSPVNWSIFLPNQPVLSLAQAWGGFSYMGFGMLLLVLFTALGVLLRVKQCKIESRESRSLLLAVLIGGGLAMLIALFPTVAWGNQIIYQFQYPQWIEQLMSPFRATGRFSWVALYLIMGTTLLIIVNHYKKRTVVMILSVALLLQIADISQVIGSRYAYYSKAACSESIMPSNAADALRADMKHVAVLPLRVNYVDDSFFYVARFASKYELTLNNYYLARKPEAIMQEHFQELFAKIRTGQAIDDTIFVINDDILLLDNKLPLVFYRINNITFGVHTAKPELAAYLIGSSHYVDLIQDKYMAVKDGKKLPDKVVLQKNGVLFGPYTLLQEGTYQVTITGNHLDSAVYDICYNSGQKVLPIEVLNTSNDRVTYRVTAGEQVDSCEFRVINRADEPVEIYSMKVSNVD